MELAEKKDLIEATDKVALSVTGVQDQVKELKHILYKLVELNIEPAPKAVKRSEAMRLLGGISRYKLKEMEDKGIIKPFKYGGDGHDFFKVRDLEKLLELPYAND